MISPLTLPNVWAWYAMVSKFSDAIKASWKGGFANPAPVQRATRVKEEKKVEATEDDFDPSAEGGEDDGEAAAALKAKAPVKSCTAQRDQTPI